MDQLVGALSLTFAPTNLLILFGATLLGMVFGALPGLSGATAMSLFIPLTFVLEPYQGILGLIALYTSSTYAGSISSILLRTPGDAPAAATVLDGYEMTRKGQAGLALGTAMVASCIGGVAAVLVLAVLTPLLVDAALKFGPAEYFGLAMLALSVVASMLGRSQVKGLIAVVLGLFLSTVGLDSISGATRFTFGSSVLMGGISLVPAILGLFALSEVFSQLLERREREPQRSGVVFPSFVSLLRMKWLLLRSTLIGIWIGILPGLGATTAAMVSYNEAVRWSKDPERYGTGIPEGVAATESANNAAASASIIPLLALGIPGSSGAALVLGGFIVHGLQPGPLFYLQQREMVDALVLGMLLANLLIVVGGLITLRAYLQLIRIPFSILAVVILLLCVIGSFSVRNTMGDVWIMLFFGALGIVFTRYGFPLATLVLGLILGPIVETSFRRAMLIYGQDFWALATRPLSGAFLALALLSLMLPLLKDYGPALRQRLGRSG